MLNYARTILLIGSRRVYALSGSAPFAQHSLMYEQPNVGDLHGQRSTVGVTLIQRIQFRTD